MGGGTGIFQKKNPMIHVCLSISGAGVILECMVKYHRFFCEVITHNTDAAGTMDDGRWCLMSHLVYVLIYIPAG